MSHWNYRILHRTHSVVGTETIYYTYAMHEVYYDGEGKPHSWTADAIAVQGDNLAECKADYEYMAEAFRQPVLKVVDDNKLEEE